MCSNISGMPADVVSGATVSARVVMEGCHGGVLDARSFSDYGANANVTIVFKDTTIATVKKVCVCVWRVLGRGHGHTGRGGQPLPIRYRCDKAESQVRIIPLSGEGMRR